MHDPETRSWDNCSSRCMTQWLPRVIWAKAKLIFSSCHSPLHKRKCHRSQTRADSGSLPEPSRETCPLRTCVSCGSGTWRPQNHRSGKTEISKYINPSLSMVIFYCRCLHPMWKSFSGAIFLKVSQSKAACSSTTCTLALSGAALRGLWCMLS